MANKASVNANPPSAKARLAQVRLPAPRAKVVRRQRLIDLLAESVSRRATIVSAPAGFGKTTLLVDYARTADRPVCWYSLEQRDRELNTLLVNLVASLREQFLNFDPKLKSLPKRPASKAIDEMVAALADGLSALEQPCVVILDDFHCLDEGATEVTRFIEGWLPRLPDNCHLIIASRTRPEISVLPLLTARQEIAVLDPADLALSCQEVKQLLAEALYKDIPLDDAQYLADATDGWSSALVLLAEKIGGPKLRPALTRLLPSDTLYQYIEAELFSPLPAPLQEFVLGCGLLRWAEPGICNELLGVTDAEEKLASLERYHLFASRPGTTSAFRSLFRAFLASKLRAEQPERFHSLHLKAAAIFEENDRWQEAVYHYLEAHSWDKVVAVTARVGHKLFEEGQWEELAECLEAIPQEELAAQP
ncbi:MAG: AAA family ATPase, partial [Dehalococcoidia bacterium]